MRIGVGLPNTIPGTPGKQLVAWAKHAEDLGFSSLQSIGRLVFPTYDELIALTAAAVATERIGLFSNITVGPVFDNVILAKQAASLDQISGGRFTLGLAVGWRETDYTVVGKAWNRRGRLLDEQVAVMQAVWRGEKVAGADKASSPTPTNGQSVPLAFGGQVPAAYERVANHGVGWTSGGLPPDVTAASFAATDAAWATAGRSGAPRKWALSYFGLGADALDVATTYLSDYYYQHGAGMAAWMPKDAAAIQATVEAYRAIGTDELFFDPTSNDLAELDRLIEALGGKTEF